MKSRSQVERPCFDTCSSKIVQWTETMLYKLTTFPYIHWVVFVFPATLPQICPAWCWIISEPKKATATGTCPAFWKSENPIKSILKFQYLHCLFGRYSKSIDFQRDQGFNFWWIKKVILTLSLKFNLDSCCPPIKMEIWLKNIDLTHHLGRG